MKRLARERQEIKENSRAISKRLRAALCGCSEGSEEKKLLLMVSARGN